MDHILLSSTWALIIEHHVAFPGMVTPPCLESFWLLCPILLDGSCILATEGVGWGWRATPVRALPSSYHSPLSSTPTPPSRLSLPCLPRGALVSCLLLQVQALRGGAGTTTCPAGHPTRGTWAVGTPGSGSSCQGPHLGCIVTRDLFPTCEVCPFPLS